MDYLVKLEDMFVIVKANQAEVDDGYLMLYSGTTLVATFVRGLWLYFMPLNTNDGH